MIDATLTLPGIAGLILTVGMAVDANIIIFARIKEELPLEEKRNIFGVMVLVKLMLLCCIIIVNV